jgi:restriction endonuclease S subunit
MKDMWKGGIHIKLQEIASIQQGINITRVESTNRTENTKEIQVLSLKEFNNVLGVAYRRAKERDSSVFIDEKRLEGLFLTEPGQVVIHLLSQQAVVLPPKYHGLILPLNFVAAKLDVTVDPDYFEWYFNEHRSIRKQIVLATQGSSVATLSVTNLKELEVSFPPIEVQKKIGAITRLTRKKQRLMKEREELQVRQTHQKIHNLLEEY